MMVTTIHGFDFELRADKTLFMPNTGSLFVADLHLGKEATFRAGGIPVPSGSTQNTLDRIALALQQTKASCLYILGDMIHDRNSLSRSVLPLLTTWLDDHQHIMKTLIVGNHDRHFPELEKLPGLSVAADLVVDRLGLIHDPAHWPDDWNQNVDLALCGHLHPAIRVQSMTDSVGKLPCFWSSRQRLVLPAMGSFTGTEVIKPRAADSVWMVADDQVIEHRIRAKQASA